MKRRHVTAGQKLSARWQNRPDLSAREDIGLDSVLFVEAIETFASAKPREDFLYFRGQVKVLGFSETDLPNDFDYEIADEDLEDQQFLVHAYNFMPLKGQRFAVRYSSQSARIEALPTSGNRVLAKIISCNGNDAYPQNWYDFGPDADLPEANVTHGYTYQCAYIRKANQYTSQIEYLEDDANEYFDVNSYTGRINGPSGSEHDIGELIPRGTIIVAEQIGRYWYTQWVNPLRVDGLILSGTIVDGAGQTDYYGDVTVAIDDYQDDSNFGNTYVTRTPIQLYGEEVIAKNTLKLFAGYETGTACLIGVNAITYGGSATRYQRPFAYFLGGRCCDDC